MTSQLHPTLFVGLRNRRQKLDRKAPIWQALRDEKDKVPSIASLFEQQPGRAGRYSLEAAGWYLDYSKHRLTEKARTLLIKLAVAADLSSAIRHLYEGRQVNPSEGRPALHIALRSPDETHRGAISEQVAAAHKCKQKVYRIAQDLRSGEWTGYSGRRIRSLLHLGIGGSHLGPEMAYEALANYRSESPINVCFVSNLDGAQITRVLQSLDPHETIINLASKSFNTLETRKNAEVARNWLLESGIPEAQLSRHLLAVTANGQAAVNFGVDPKNLLPMWNWVGGRYSLWSATGLPLAVSLGPDWFESLLSGAHAMDQHFASAPLEANMPVVMGLLGVWYNNIWGAESHAILPYDHGLRLLPSHLQQLEMESNGKSATLDGQEVCGHTGPVIWGGEGTSGQHTFHQLLHQGTRLVPVDFICAARPNHELHDHHDWLIANCLAQAQALMVGCNEPEIRKQLIAEEMSPDQAATAASHRRIPGNRPSSLLMTEQLNPSTVGALVALYEHKVFVQACIWNINPFDQWGVELGKVLATDVHKCLLGSAELLPKQDPSTAELISRYRQLNNRREGICE